MQDSVLSHLPFKTIAFHTGIHFSDGVLLSLALEDALKTMYCKKWPGINLYHKMHSAHDNKGKTTNHEEWHRHHLGSNTVQCLSISFPNRGEKSNQPNQNQPKIYPQNPRRYLFRLLLPSFHSKPGQGCYSSEAWDWVFVSGSEGNP